MNRPKTTLFGILLALTLAGPSWGENAFEEGLRHYQAGRYKFASDSWLVARKFDPLNPMVHYYLANALVYQGEHKAAIEEYKEAYLLDPNGNMATYCLGALAGYHVSKPDLKDAQKLRDTLSAGQQYTSPTYSQNFSAHSPELQKTFSTIRRQVNYEKNKHNDTGTDRAKLAMSIGQEEVRKINEQAEIEIQKCYEPLVYPGPRTNPLLLNPELLKERVDEIRARAKEESARVMQKAQERVSNYQDWAKGAGNSLDEVASNLESQLENGNSQHGVKLQTVGTDLYVRYYGTSSPYEKVPDVHRAIARIHGQRVGDNLPDADLGTADSLNKNQIDQQVKGKILR